MADLHFTLLRSKPGEQMQFHHALDVDLSSVDELIGAMKALEIIEIQAERK